MSGLMTVDQFKAALPPAIKQSVNQELIDSVNNALADPESMEIFRDNLLSFTSVLQQGKFKLSSYINAVRYVGYKVMGLSNKDSYIRTFPDKYQKFLNDGVNQKDIASYITAYNKSKLVNLIFEQALIPTHILNAPLFQQAINVQARLMNDDNVSAKVRCDAANSLLTHLKPPEVKKVELDIGLKTDSTIETLQATIRDLAQQQQQLIQKGVPVQTIAHSQLVIDAEFDQVSP
jgi:hypothetical protein